jgi:hypothetical protein
MSPAFVILVLALVLSILIGRDLTKWAIGASKKLDEKKRAAQTLAAKLRDYGLKQIPAMLEDFVVGDWTDMVNNIHDFARLLNIGGDDAILKELDSTFQNVLDKKLSTPEGLAYLQAKVASATQPTPPVKS